MSTYKEMFKSCKHSGVASFITNGVMYHFKGVRQIRCQDFDVVDISPATDGEEDQSSSERKSLTNDAGCVKMRHRSGRELACIKICEFSNGTCECKSKGAERLCSSVETVYEQVIELTVKD